MPSTSHAALPGVRAPDAGFDQPFAMLSACHERVQRSLRLLRRLLEHIEAHGIDDQARTAAQDVWRYFELAAPQHHEDEERHVIPALLASGDAALVDAAQRMRGDHQRMHAQWHDKLGPRLQALHQGGAKPDLMALKADADAFAALYAEHVPLEDDLAFPRAQALIDEDGRRAMGAEMAARRRV